MSATSKSKSPLDAEIDEFCLEHLGASPDRILFPGGRDRKTIVVEAKGQSYALAKRSSIGRADLEARVLKVGSKTALVPELIAQDGAFVLQSFVKGTRLTERLEFGDHAERIELLEQAGRSLLTLQSSASWAPELKKAPRIGQRKGWALDFARTPLLLADQLQIGLSDYDINSVAALINSSETAFVKWDSRPGNAIVSDQGKIVWIDWEHAGFAAPEDDLVWLLADEWSPNIESVERSLMMSLAKSIDEPIDAFEMRFKIKVILHSTIRLGLIFRRKGDGSWWNVREALKHDRVGVSRGHVQRVCKRAYRLSKSVPEMRSLCEFFSSIHEFTSAN